MTVSVIIPNYNHAKYLPQRIESILSQTFSDFEIIILDDASTDNSSEIINGYASANSKIKYFTSNLNSGSPFAQWQKGISLAKGEFVWIAESDDFAENTFLEKCVALMRMHVNAGIVYCNSRVINEVDSIQYLVSEKEAAEGNRRWMSDYYNTGLNEVVEHMYLRNTIYNVSSVLFRRSKLPGTFDEESSMKFCGDWLMYLRILLDSDIAYTAEPLSTFRIHSDSSFKKYYKGSRYLKEVISVYQLAIKHLEFNPVKYLRMSYFLLRITRRILLSRY
jgi:glycosyltransferase involved in cell wall biosynthesis